MATDVAWTQVDAAIPDRAVTLILVDPTNANTVYVALGGFSPYQTYYAQANLWKTTDGGASWSAAAGSGLTGLPNLPIWSIAVHPSNSNWLYVGTEFGAFTSEDAGATWKVTLDGPANVPVYDLQWMGNTLIAGTHGRGVFKSDTNAPAVQRITATRVDDTHATYTVYFNKVVTNVDTADFKVTATGSAVATVSSVSGSGYTYAVTVTAASGTGSVRLDTATGI